MQSIRNHFYTSDLRHIDLIQWLGHYCIDVDNRSYYNMSTPQLKMIVEFKHIHRGFIPNINRQYQIKDLVELAGEKKPLFIIYVAPGPLPSHLECNEHYSILEEGYDKKFTTYSNWSFLVQPLNKLGADLIGNKSAKPFNLRQFYEWLCCINKVEINQDLFKQLSTEHSAQFNLFVKSVLSQI